MKVDKVAAKENFILFVVVGADDGGLIFDVVHDVEVEIINGSRIKVVWDMVAVQMEDML